jgi:hypothetical protein
MKSSLMKLNHVSTFLGKGQPEIWFKELDSRLEDFRKKQTKFPFTNFSKRTDGEK